MSQWWSHLFGAIKVTSENERGHDLFKRLHFNCKLEKQQNKRSGAAWPNWTFFNVTSSFFFKEEKLSRRKKRTAGQTDVAASTLRGFTMSGFAPSLRREKRAWTPLHQHWQEIFHCSPSETMNKPGCPLQRTATTWMQHEVLLKIYSKLHTFPFLSLLSYLLFLSLHIANSPAHHLFFFFSLSGCDFAGGAGAEQEEELSK